MTEKNYRLYFGKKFYKQKDGYWANMMPIHAHRWVWINHHGTIPKGMDIHHIDGDKDNNEIENLAMLSRSDHLKEHWKDPELRKERRKQLDKWRPKAHEWLRSLEGRKKQSDDAIEGWKKRKNFTISCLQCKREVCTSQSWTKFCSDACDKKWRRHAPEYQVESKCDYCNENFLRPNFLEYKFCSRSCGAKNSAKERKQKQSRNSCYK